MNILLIDGHRLFSEGLRNTLIAQPDIDKVYISNESGFIMEPYLSSIHVIICDMNEPGMTGLRVIETVRNHLREKVNIAMLSCTTDLQTIKQSVRLGADAFISKNSDIAELLDAIRSIRSGKRFISKSLRVNLLNDLSFEEKKGSRLTGREQELLREFCIGRTIKDIAADMGISPHTVQYYQRSIMRKLKLSRTADLIVYAVRNGLYTASAGK